MTRQIGLPLAAALKLVAIGAALVLDRSATGVPAIILLPVMAMVVGLTLGRGDRKLSAVIAGAAGAVNTVGFPIVLLVIHHFRFGGDVDGAGLIALAIMLAVGGLLVAPAAAWFLARKADGSSKIAA